MWNEHWLVKPALDAGAMGIIFPIIRSAEEAAVLEGVVDEVIVGNVDPFGTPESVCGAWDFEDAVCYQSDAGKWANVMASQCRLYPGFQYCFF